MEKEEEICGYGCSCSNAEDCHTYGVINYIRLHDSDASYKEDYPLSGGEDVRECYRCRDKFLGAINRFCCKTCLPIVEKLTDKGTEFKLKNLNNKMETPITVLEKHITVLEQVITNIMERRYVSTHLTYEELQRVISDTEENIQVFNQAIEKLK